MKTEFFQLEIKKLIESLGCLEVAQVIVNGTSFRALCRVKSEKEWNRAAVSLVTAHANNNCKFGQSIGTLLLLDKNDGVVKRAQFITWTLSPTSTDSDLDEVKKLVSAVRASKNPASLSAEKSTSNIVLMGNGRVASMLKNIREDVGGLP